MEINNKLIWEGPFKSNDSFGPFGSVQNTFRANTPLGLIRINFHYDSEDYSLENKKMIANYIDMDRFREQGITINCDIEQAKSIAEEWLQQKFSQLFSIFVPNPYLDSAQRMHQVFVNKYVNICKEHVGKTPKEIPEITNISIAIDVLEELYPDTKFKG